VSLVESKSAVAALGSADAATRLGGARRLKTIAERLCKANDPNGLRKVAGIAADALFRAAYVKGNTDETQRLAIEALSYLAPVCKAVAPFLEADLDMKSSLSLGPIAKASLAVVELGPVAGTLFANALHDSDAELRTLAARYLGQLKLADKQIALALMGALKDPNHLVVQEAAFAIGETARMKGKVGLPYDRVVPELLRVAKDSKYFGTSLAAKMALGDIGPPAEKALPFLRARISANSNDIEAGYAVARIAPEDPAGLDFLIRLVESHTPVTSFNACIILGRIGPPARRAIPAIEKHLVARNDFVKRVKADVLRALRRDATN